jgi:predicted transcriptional regulator
MVRTAVLPANVQAAIQRMATDIITAYLTCNSLRPEQAAPVFAMVRSALQSAALRNARYDTDPYAGVEDTQRAPAVPISQSITPRYLICLEEGHRCRNLEQHLRTAHRMCPAEYRQKWELPAFYPMQARQHRPKLGSKTSFKLDRGPVIDHGSMPEGMIAGGRGLPANSASVSG